MMDETRRVGSKINRAKWKAVGKTVSFVLNLLTLALLLGFKFDKISEPVLLTVAIAVVGIDTLVELLGLIKL